MKRKKTIKQRLAETGYAKPNLERKLNTLEKSLNEVKKLINNKNG